MKKITLLVLLTGFNFFAFSQMPDSVTYLKTSYMIPMRDGILLNTVVLTPVNNNMSYPFLIVRTPYGVDGGLPEGNLPITIHKKFFFL